MKVVVGVCGIGYGHSLRQASVVSELKRRGHSIVILGFLCSTAFFRDRFPEIPCFEVRRPWLPPAVGGLDFGTAANDKRNLYSDGNAVNFTAFDKILSLFGGSPDLVISDYCPIAAQLAYGTCTSLVTVDNQSKFMGYQFPKVGARTRDQERCRLNLFFPHADCRISTSFFKVTYERDPKYCVEIIPPLIRPEIAGLVFARNTQEVREIVVYLSYHPAIKEGSEKGLQYTISILRHFPTFRFMVYVHKGDYGIVDNVTVQPFDATTFPNQLERASAVISTAGDGIISEAMYLGKPVLAIPLSSYEQEYNALIVSELGLGNSCDSLSDETLTMFLSRIDQLRANIRSGVAAGKLQLGDGLQALISRLESQYGI